MQDRKNEYQKQSENAGLENADCWRCDLRYLNIINDNNCHVQKLLVSGKQVPQLGEGEAKVVYSVIHAFLLNVNLSCGFTDDI